MRVPTVLSGYTSAPKNGSASKGTVVRFSNSYKKVLMPSFVKQNNAQFFGLQKLPDIQYTTKQQ